MKNNTTNRKCREQQEMDCFESFAWLIYKEVEKYINEHLEEFENLSEREEKEDVEKQKNRAA